MMAPITPLYTRHAEILSEIAHELQIPVVPTSDFTETHSELWLPHDGHFSPAGARAMAALVADFLGRLPPAPSSAPGGS